MHWPVFCPRCIDSSEACFRREGGDERRKANVFWLIVPLFFNLCRVDLCAPGCERAELYWELNGAALAVIFRRLLTLELPRLHAPVAIPSSLLRRRPCGAFTATSGSVLGVGVGVTGLK